MAGMFETGVSSRSGTRPNPPLHIVVRVGNDWKTWCGGGPAIKGFVTVTGRRCPKCVALAKADLTELEVGEDEASEFDWYLGRRPRRGNGG